MNPRSLFPAICAISLAAISHVAQAQQGAAARPGEPLKGSGVAKPQHPSSAALRPGEPIRGIDIILEDVPGGNAIRQSDCIAQGGKVIAQSGKNQCVGRKHRHSSNESAGGLPAAAGSSSKRTKGFVKAYDKVQVNQ